MEAVQDAAAVCIFPAAPHLLQGLHAPIVQHQLQEGFLIGCVGFFQECIVV